MHDRIEIPKGGEIRYCQTRLLSGFFTRMYLLVFLPSFLQALIVAEERASSAGTATFFPRADVTTCKTFLPRPNACIALFLRYVNFFKMTAGDIHAQLPQVPKASRSRVTARRHQVRVGVSTEQIHPTGVGISEERALSTVSWEALCEHLFPNWLRG